MTEQEEFLKELGAEETNADILNAPLTDETEAPEEPEKVEKEEEDEGWKAKNRRERRLLKHQQELREEALMYKAQVDALKEAGVARTPRTEEDDFLKSVERIYGTDTPEGKSATELFKEALRGVQESTRQKVIDEVRQMIQEERETESRELAQADEQLDDMMEAVEEEYGVDFSNSAERNGFLSMLERMSPKDSEGNIVEYADPYAAYEFYQASKERKGTRAKEIASRSMAKGGEAPSTLQDDATLRILRDQGII